jgi:hypothetical protein
MKSHWENVEINIGRVPQRTEKKFYFQALDSIPAITRIIPGCGCSNYRYDKDTGRLHITFNVGRLPYHLQGAEQTISKNFKIEYSDGTYEVLIFTGKKTRS